MKIPTVLFVFVILILDSVHSQQFPPRFPQNAFKIIKEDLANGSLITSFEVTDPDSNTITLGIYDYFTRRSVYLNQTQTNNQRVTGYIYLINPDNFDYDQGHSEVKLTFTATDEQYNQVSGFVTIYVTDVNDNPPVFRRPAYIYDIPENSPYPSVHSACISATDADDGVNKLFVYKLKATGQSSDLYEGVFSIDPYDGNLILKKPLDYEKLSFYQHIIEAVDKGTPPMTGTAEITIKVKDVQDTPPNFQGLPYIFTVIENSTWAGEDILAFDGDRGDPRSIEYEMVNDTDECSQLFSINTVSGKLSIKRYLNRDSGTLLNKQGVCRFDLKAKEITKPGESTANSTASTTVTVIVDDINDNVPTFDQSHYEAYVEEEVSNIPLTIVGLTGIGVSDIDQGLNSEFTLAVKYTNGTEFTGIETAPSLVYSRATVLLRLVNGFEFDYETVHNIKLHVIATEKINTRRFTTCTVSVTIKKTKENDYNTSVSDCPTCTCIAASHATKVTEENVSTTTTNTVSTATNTQTTPISDASTTVVPASTPATRSDIECLTNSISLHIPLGLLPTGQQVTWQDPSCVVADNGTHLVGTIGLGDCGTYVVFNSSHVTFENELVSSAGSTSTTTSGIDYGSESNSVIVVQCVYPRRETGSTAFRPVQGRVRFFEKTIGHMQVHMRQARDATFADIYPSQTEPREVHLNDKLYIKLTADQGSPVKVAINVDRCLATPSPSPLDTEYQELTNNGCPAIPSVSIHNSSSSEVHLSFRAFQFRSHPGAPVYVHCEVYVCPLSHPQCVAGCTNIAAARTRRAALSDVKSHLVSTGPFPVTNEKEQGAFGGQSIALIAVTGLCACLAVVATVFGILAWKGMRRQAKEIN